MFYNPLYKPHNRGKARGMSVAGGDEAPPGLPSLGSVRIFATSMAALMCWRQ